MLEPLPILFWILANLLGELLWLPAVRKHGYLSMAIAANFATLLLLPLWQAVLVTTLAGAVADFLFRHRRWYQILFNASVTCIAVFSASRVFSSVGVGRTGLENLLSPLNVGALALSAAAYFLLNTWLVSGVVALDERLTVCRVWRKTFASRQEILGSAILFIFGLLFAVLFLSWGFTSVFVVTIATYIVRQAYKRFISTQEATASRLGVA